jgi:hypothetical protein
MQVCPRCGAGVFAGRGMREIDKRRLAPGFTLSTAVWDEKPRGPKLITTGRYADYWVCRSCGHDWEETH